jgi:hypothetical protein
MTAENNIVISENANALLVPTTAIRGNRIALVRDGKVELVDVKTGARDAKNIEIRDGLGAEDVIVARYPDKIEGGSSVRTIAARP